MKWGLQDVRVSRGGNLALAGVTVPVDPSRITAVVGGDGAGKSSCLDVLVGLLEPDAGTVRRPPKERLGYVPATAGLYPDLTVQENLDFSARAYRLSGREYRQKSGELLERTGLGRARDRLGGQLSGGMQRKLAVGHGPPARTRAAGPRRADHRGRPGEPRGALAAHFRGRRGWHRRRGHHDLRERGRPRGLRGPA